MILEVVWSDFAEVKIDEIFEYHKTEVSLRIAKKLISNLIKATDILVQNPYAGQIEELLTKRKENYRYLLYKNYKIIYSVDSESKLIKIADVFDVRQNPIKIIRNK